ncbi:MAG: glycosyltransferase family 1 protein [Thermostichales cyanobacterium SZTDM-1c_bins_54]
MRIALFTETFLPKVDGIVTRLCHTIRHLTAHGNEVVVIAPKGAPRRFARARIFGMPGVPLPLYPELTLAAPGPAIGRVLRRFRPDVIHVVNPAVLGLGGLYYSQTMGIPLVASYHTHLPKYLRHYGLGFLEGLLWHLLKLGHNQARLNLCTSSAMVKELHQHGIERLQLWQRGVDTELFHPQAYSAAMRQRLTDGEPERPLLLYVGRLSAEKEVSRLRILLEHLPQTRLALVGDGPGRAELEHHFAGYPVVFTGYLQGQELAAAYASADIFVFPSRTETLGLVLLEAMAAGCPVVAPRSGGITDVVNHGINGFLFDPDSDSQFVAATQTLLTSHRDPYRQQARLEAERWSWDAATRQLESYYRGVTQQP